MPYARVTPKIPAIGFGEVFATLPFDLSLVIKTPTPAPAEKELVSGVSAQTWTAVPQCQSSGTSCATLYVNEAAKCGLIFARSPSACAELS